MKGKMVIFQNESKKSVEKEFHSSKRINEKYPAYKKK